MPKDFPPWKTVYDHFSKWNKRGAWEKYLDRLTAYHRLKEGRAALPSYGIIDAQSVKTQYASEERGIDGGKKVKGHKRHIVVDILGNLLYVSAASEACRFLQGESPCRARSSQPPVSSVACPAERCKWFRLLQMRTREAKRTQRTT